MSNTAPLITIITVTYNAAANLPATMRSVAEQMKGLPEGSVEHLLIDGASKDGTVDVARSIPNPGLRIFSEPDRGLYDAMNKGLKRARGRYVLFLNAGDAFHGDGALRAFYEGAEAGADIVYGDTVLVDARRRVLGPRHLSVPEILDKRSFSRGMLVCHQAMLVRRDLAGEYDIRWRFSSDYDWSIRCIERSDPAHNINLHRVTTEFLAEGTTADNKKASLVERLRIMAHHYGWPVTLYRHLSFIPRAVLRRLSKRSSV